MFALILTAAIAAPVPTHLQRPAPDPIVPGFKWLYDCYELEVVRVDGDEVTYRCRNVPCRQWQASPHSPEGQRWSVQSRQTTLNEWRKFGVPVMRYKPLESPEW